MKKLILVDGNSLMFRSYYATAYTGSLMQTKNGLYTNALFGFCNMFNKVLELADGYLFVAFDAGKQTFRHQEYAEYKGKRQKMPDEMRVQIPYVKKYLDLMGINRSETLDYEADDLIASCSKKFYNDFEEIVIISGDKDLLQLVDKKIKVCLTRKGIGELEEFTENNFFEKMNIYPNQVVDYKGLVGDSSDNLPGIKGIGEKTASKLLLEYKTLEGILDNLDKISGKTKQLFIDNKEIGLKCKHLATLVSDAPLEINVEDLRTDKKKVDELIDFFKEVEFYSMIKKLDKPQVELTSNVKIIEKEEDIPKSILENDSYMIVEVFRSNYYNGELLGISLVNDTDEVFLTKEVLKSPKVKEYLENEAYQKKTFDLKAAYVSLKKIGINLKGVTFDLLLAAYLINPSYASDDLKAVSSNFSENGLEYLDKVYGANTKMAIPFKEVYADYAAKKALVIKSLLPLVLEEIKKVKVEELLAIELKLSLVLGDMEYNGLKVDLDHLEKIGESLNERANLIQKEIFEIVGHEFNIGSPKQLGEVLFEELKLPHGKKNKTGYSTGAEVLDKLAPRYSIVQKILDYRGLTKLISTYVNGLRDVSNNSFVHPLYKQALTTTGRLSSIEPNIQNIPVRTEDGQVIREVFISRYENGKIISADYSQIELRVLASMSGDEAMIASFNSHIDFHSQTASQIYEIPLDKVTKEMRRTAKAINFGIVYGMSAWGLSETLNISPIEANLYINKYFFNYEKVKEFLDDTVKKAKENGYTRTLFNRRRYLPEINSENGNLRSFGERTAMNAPIQGTAADIIKIAMIKVNERMKKENLKSLMIAQVHDELVFDCVEEEIEILKTLVKEEMENAVKLKVALISEVNVGDNWFEAK